MNPQIETIISKAPGVSSTMETLAKSSDTLHASADELNQFLQNGISEMSTVFAALVEANETFQATAVEARGELETGMDELKTEMEELNSRIDQANEEARADLENADAGMEEFRELINTGTQVIEEANGTTETAIEDFFGIVEQGENEMKGIVDTANQGVEALAEGVADSLAKAAEEITAMTESIREIGTTTGNDINQFQEFLGTTAEMLVDAFDIFGGDVSQSVGTIFETAQQEFIDGLLNQVDNVVERVGDSIQTQVRDVIIGEADRCGIERAIMEPAVTALTDVMDPVTDALEYVQNLAASVGISI